MLIVHFNDFQYHICEGAHCRCFSIIDGKRYNIIENFYFRENLSAIAFPETKLSAQIKTLLVVKEEITRIENLRQKQGCFSQYGDIGECNNVGHKIRGWSEKFPTST